MVVEAYLPDLYESLGIFLSLIVVNCIVLGRAEMFASKNSVGESFLDGLGNGLGYSVILIALGFVRELFGSGTLWGYPVMEKLGLYEIGYENNGLMIMPPMALILVGLIIWWHRSRNKDLCEK
jgi:Na+-transporting NADH:ubiquinone oxidoreductase subunit D